MDLKVNFTEGLLNKPPAGVTTKEELFTWTQKKL
jgi:hypothetical protein